MLMFWSHIHLIVSFQDSSSFDSAHKYVKLFHISKIWLFSQILSMLNPYFSQKLRKMNEDFNKNDRIIEFLASARWCFTPLYY